MPMMNKDPIVFVFNSPLASGCDYVLQTIRVVSLRYPTYGVALGDVISLPKLIVSRDRWIVRMVNGGCVIRPVSLVPGVRFRIVRMSAYVLASFVLWVYIQIHHSREEKYVWFFEPFHIFPLLRFFYGYRTIYDCVDYYPGFHAYAKKEHNLVLQRATHVFANSKGLVKKLTSVRPDTISVPLGFARSLFDKRKVDPILPMKSPFTVGYIGSISDRMDFCLLEYVVNKLPSIQFLFVGQLESNVFGVRDQAATLFTALRRYSNVRWIPGVPKRRIPEILSKMDACIVPYRVDLLFNQYSFPMKVMEYFASGKPVITTDIFALRQYAQDGLLTLARSPEEFTLGIQQYALHGWNAASQKRQVVEALHNTWISKVSRIMSVLNGNTLRS